jgi:aconitase A
MFWEPNFKNRERNEAIQNSVCLPALTTATAAATSLRVGMEVAPLAQGLWKGQKIVSFRLITKAVRLEFVDACG